MRFIHGHRRDPIHGDATSRVYHRDPHQALDPESGRPAIADIVGGSYYESRGVARDGGVKAPTTHRDRRQQVQFPKTHRTAIADLVGGSYYMDRAETVQDLGRRWGKVRCPIRRCAGTQMAPVDPPVPRHQDAATSTAPTPRAATPRMTPAAYIVASLAPSPGQGGGLAFFAGFQAPSQGPPPRYIAGTMALADGAIMPARYVSTDPNAPAPPVSSSARGPTAVKQRYLSRPTGNKHLLPF